MEAVYGRRRYAANAGSRETWMDRFARLQPESGVRAAVRLAWSNSASMSSGVRPVNSRNGRIAIEAVYGRERGNCKTWIDLFTKLNPEGGFRAVVEEAWFTPGLRVVIAALAS
jgi:hypothetical protein